MVVERPLIFWPMKICVYISDQLNIVKSFSITCNIFNNMTLWTMNDRGQGIRNNSDNRQQRIRICKKIALFAADNSHHRWQQSAIFLQHVKIATGAIAIADNAWLSFCRMELLHDNKYKFLSQVAVVFLLQRTKQLLCLLLQVNRVFISNEKVGHFHWACLGWTSFFMVTMCTFVLSVLSRFTIYLSWYKMVKLQ